MAGVRLPTPAWLLPARHPGLCAGGHTAAAHCYPIPTPVTCPVCQQPVRTYPAPSVPGGGRIAPHYRPDRSVQLSFEETARG